MDQQDTTQEDAGYISGDSTITMLSTTPSPPPGMESGQSSRGSTAHGNGQHGNDHGPPRSQTGESAVVRSNTSPSSALSISRVPTFDEFMELGDHSVSTAASEASTLILPRNSSGRDSYGEGASASASIVLTGNHSPTHIGCTMRDEHSGQCICMCNGPCFVQENASLATEIANLFPKATRQELSSLSVADVVYKFLGNAHSSSAQVGNGNFGEKVNHQTADPYSRDRRGIQLLLDAHAFLSASEAHKKASTRGLPGTTPRTKEITPPEWTSGNTVTRVESEAENDMDMITEEPAGYQSDDTIIDKEMVGTESDVEMSGHSTDTYIPSSASSSDSDS